MSKYSAMPTAGSKKISSSQPLAASGERRNGTTTIIAMRTAHSAAKKTSTQKVWSVRSAGIAVIASRIASRSIGARSSIAAGLGARDGARSAAAAASRCLDRRGVRATDNRDAAQCMKGFPRDAGRVGHPVFVGAHIAAVGILFRNEAPIRCQELSLHRVELGRAFNLEAEMIDARAAAVGRYGKVDAWIV